MARLINDTGVMGEKFKATSKNVNEVPFNKIVEAIHKTQKEMGVTGTTSKEASETISGSYGMMKASVTDFLGTLTMSGSEGMSEFKMNVYDTFMNLVTSTFTFGKNFGAAVSRLFDNVATLISNHGPGMAKQGMEFLANLSKGFTDDIPNFVSHVLDLFEAFADNMAANMPEILLMGKEMLSNIITGLTNAIPELVARVPVIINKFAGLIDDYAPTILKCGFDLIVQLGQGLIQAVPVIVANIPNILMAIMNVWEAFNWINLGRQAIKLIGTGITVLGTTVPNAVRSVGNKAIVAFKGVNWIDIGKNVVGLIGKAITAVGSIIVTALKSTGTKAMSSFKTISWSSVGKAVVNLIKAAISSAGGMIVSALKSVGTKALSSFKGISWKSLGTNIINGIKNGITGAASGLYSSLKNLASNALKSAKKFLGIHSPSRVFADQVGSMIPSGIALGISANTSSLMDTIDDLGSKAVIATTNAVNIDDSSYQRDTFSSASVDNDREIQLNEVLKKLDMFLNKEWSFNIDGRTFARATIRDINKELSRVAAWEGGA